MENQHTFSLLVLLSLALAAIGWRCEALFEDHIGPVHDCLVERTTATVTFGRPEDAENLGSGENGEHSLVWWVDRCLWCLGCWKFVMVVGCCVLVPSFQFVLWDLAVMLVF